MNRLSVPLAAILVLGLASPAAIGQDSKKSSDRTQKPPTFVVEDDEGGAVKGVEVALPPSQTREVKQYPIEHQGPSAQGVTVFVPKVVYYSDGRMRVHFSFWNRSKEGQTLYFDFEEFFLADERSNPYPQVARQVIGGNRGGIHMVTITSDRRFNTWIDFKAPETPTTRFKVGVMLEGRYDHRADAFKPFVIDLTEPLPPLAKKLKAGGESKDEGSVVPKVEVFDEMRPGRATPTIIHPEEPDVPARPTLAATEAVLAAAKDGRKYEGNIRSMNGTSASGGIHFERRPEGRLLGATIYRHGRPDRDLWLVGDFHQRHSAPGGLVVRFADFRKVEYTFTIDGRNMRGTDTEGNAYTFLFVKEE